MTLSYSLCIPTYNRAEMLAQCLERLVVLDYAKDAFEVLVIDNGKGEDTAAVVEGFIGRLNVTHLVNEVNRGLGYSINRGYRSAQGQRIVSMNDDALVPPTFLRDCDRVFDSDPRIGALGVRAVEKGYIREGTGIGIIDRWGKVIGNFDTDCGEPIEVDHVYGFCYVVTRASLEATGVNDEVLLAKPYSSGARLETDHCLSIKAKGFRVVYDPSIAVEHKALPRPDMPERTLRWKFHGVRNTLYLLLKHYGLFGRNAVALRYAVTNDLGIRSAILHPSWFNWKYFWNGLSARCSAFWHYAVYLATPVRGLEAERIEVAVGER